MSDLPPDHLERIGSGKRNRFEARTVIALVIGVLVLGSAYVAIVGSPSRDRAAVDSPRSNAPQIWSRSVQKPAPHP